jgi:phosphohistidine phosphatase SixA
LAAKVYRPEAVIISKKVRARITHKTCVASAKANQLKAMKQLLESAAKKQGMTKQTHITVLADGGKNCWQAVSVLAHQCNEIDYILDWFHIGKLFQPLLVHLKAKTK